MPRNTTRNNFGVSGRKGSGMAHFVSNPLQETPPRPLAATVSTRLPIILDYREKLASDQRWHYVSLNYISSDVKTRSPVANRSAEAYSAYNMVMSRPDLANDLYEKSRSINLSDIGRWREDNPRIMSSSQRTVMGAGAHDTIISSTSNLGPEAEQFQDREGESPVNKSHWLHLIAYSLSDIDPQHPNNLVAGSAGANYDHVIFENAVLQIVERGEFTHGTYSVSALCLPGDVAVLIRCELELQLQNECMKKISFTFDPTKEKLTDQRSAAHDEQVIITSIMEFIHAPIRAATFTAGVLAEPRTEVAGAADVADDDLPAVIGSFAPVPVAVAALHQVLPPHRAIEPRVLFGVDDNDKDMDVDMSPKGPRK